MSRSCASLGPWSFLLKNSRRSATPPTMAPAMAPVPARKMLTNKAMAVQSLAGCSPAIIRTIAKPTRKPTPAPTNEKRHVRPIKHRVSKGLSETCSARPCAGVFGPQGSALPERLVFGSVPKENNESSVAQRLISRPPRERRGRISVRANETPRWPTPGPEHRTPATSGR